MAALCVRIPLLLLSILPALLYVSQVASVSGSPSLPVAQRVRVSFEEADAAFTAWLKKYKRNFPASEIAKRFGIFWDNMRFVRSHNAQNLPYKVALNQFAHLSFKEFKAKYLRPMAQRVRSGVAMGLIKDRLNLTRLVGDFGKIVPPKEIDWRLKGAVTPVKNQGACGKCRDWLWAAGSPLAGVRRTRVEPMSRP